MSLRKLLGRILFFGMLQLGALSGVKMTSDDIEQLMNVMNRTRVVHVLRRDRDKDDQR